jgi:hypothetical protein
VLREISSRPISTAIELTRSKLASEARNVQLDFITALLVEEDERGESFHKRYATQHGF